MGIKIKKGLAVSELARQIYDVFLVKPYEPELSKEFHPLVCLWKEDSTYEKGLSGALIDALKRDDGRFSVCTNTSLVDPDGNELDFQTNALTGLRELVVATVPLGVAGTESTAILNTDTQTSTLSPAAGQAISVWEAQLSVSTDSAFVADAVITDPTAQIWFATSGKRVCMVAMEAADGNADQRTGNQFRIVGATNEAVTFMNCGFSAGSCTMAGRIVYTSA